MVEVTNQIKSNNEKVWKISIKLKKRNKNKVKIFSSIRIIK